MLRKSAWNVYCPTMATDISFSDHIAQTIAEEIIRGDRLSGERLAQDHIARQFSCSHVPAREALQRLVAMELAVAVPRKGTRVAGLSPEDHRDILDIRLALEPLALRLAIPHVTNKDLQEFERLRAVCDAAHDAINWEMANRAFHLAILRPCSRKRLMRKIEDLQRISARYFHKEWRQSWIQRTDRDHAAICDAIARKDTKAATALLERHLQRG
jgi:DNA-binding GntR family transcriptional regulator